MEKCIIAAVAANRAIGRGNQLLWHIREDLKFFKRTTAGFPVIMGRNTWFSLRRPLPGRLNIVVSSRGGFEVPEGVLVVPSIRDAYAACSCPDTGSSPARCFIIGGEMLYLDTINDADRLYITHIEASPENADAFFPAINPSLWNETGRSETFTDHENGLQFSFAEYTRR